MPTMAKRASRSRAAALGAIATVAAVHASQAGAVPAFAVQTGQPCAACHVGGFGPQLTSFGRSFKLGGYTLRSQSLNVPVSAMAIASYLHTNTAQPSPPAAHFSDNDNFAVDQISLFLAGGFSSHLGAFIQTTYDGVARAFHWDNLDVRAVTTATVRGAKVVLGVSVNNAPTVQDAFNTLPAWSFPYTSSSLALMPGAAPIIGAFAQNTIGATAYAWINSALYVEAGGYGSPGATFLTRAGVDPASPGNIRHIAPYGRIAFEKDDGDRNWQIGAFAMDSKIEPGLDRTTGLTDHYTDLGLDGSVQLYRRRRDVATLNLRYTYEKQALGATYALGGASNIHNHLQDLRLDASYYFGEKVGFTVGGFDTWGSSDPLLYGGNTSLSPESNGVVLQVDGTPWGRGGSPLGPRFNMRVGIQYTNYFKFNGAGSNYDGTGRNASDNNAVRVFTWFAY
jgi:hypothetical protein